MYMYTERAKYLVYLDGDEHWLRIRQRASGVLINLEVYKFLELLRNGGKIELNEKKTKAKTLAFYQSSGYLRSDDHYIDIFATTVNENRQKLLRTIQATVDNTTTMTRTELRVEAEIMRKYGFSY